MEMVSMTQERSARARLSGEALAETVRSAADGNQRAWDTLVHEFNGLIWAVTRAHRMTHADAADVAQTTWVSLVAHLDELRTPAAVGSWLATTARRECLRVLRDRVRCVPTAHEDSGAESPEAAPLKELLIAERDLILWRAFERLRPGDQALLRLLTADPRPSYEDISAALEMPVGSIGPTRARALERLRREVERDANVAGISVGVALSHS